MARPKTDSELAMLRRKRLVVAELERYGFEAVSTVIEVMRDKEAKPADRLKAAQTILDYNVVKPKPEAAPQRGGNPAADILSALRQLGQANPNAETNVLISLENSDDPDKLVINTGKVIDNEDSAN